MPPVDHLETPALDVANSAPAHAPEVERSTSDPRAAGNAAAHRIAEDEGEAPFTMGIHPILVSLLGPLASEITPAEIPHEVTASARKIIMASRPRTSSAGLDSRAANREQARRVLDQLLLEEALSLTATCPQAKALIEKFRPFEDAHPGLILESLVLATSAVLGRDAQIPALSHSMKVGENVTLKAGVGLGSIRNVGLSSIDASIQYRTQRFSAAASLAASLAAKTTHTKVEMSWADMELLSTHIDKALVQYQHVTFPGNKPPTDQIMGQIAFKLNDVGIKLSQTNTWAQVAPPRVSPTGGAGHARKPAPQSGDRKQNQKLTEEANVPLGDGYRLKLDATQHFGQDHAQHSIGAALQMPRVHGVGITVGENIPVGSGNGKPSLSIELEYKGIKFAIKQGAPLAANAVAPAGGAQQLGRFSETHHGWNVSITLPFGGKSGG